MFERCLECVLLESKKQQSERRNQNEALERTSEEAEKREQETTL